MLPRRAFLVLACLTCLAAAPAPKAGTLDPAKGKAEGDVVWYDARTIGIEGRGWPEKKAPFDRLPAKAEKIVRKPVWELSRQSAGLCVRFRSDATTIQARWTLTSKNLAMPHMPATGVSGLDLYVFVEGKWHWLANGRPEQFPTNEKTLVTGLEAKSRDYLLYLPLYNGVEQVEIGVPESVKVERTKVQRKKPVLFYGSSILQGGCAARPGMAYPSIIGRMLNVPTINLGFSGNGKCEPEMASLLAELDPSVFVFDSLPNLTPEEAIERVEPLLATFRKAHPKTPIVLVENTIPHGSLVLTSRKDSAVKKNATLRSLFSKLSPEDPNLFYVDSRNLLGNDDEGTVDGVHPTDLGFVRMAETIRPFIKQALERSN